MSDKKSLAPAFADAGTEIEALRGEIRALNEQVKLLARTERRLDTAQRQICAQLRHSEALNTLVLRAGLARDPEAIVGLTLETLLDLFGMHHGAAFLRPLHSEGDALVLAAMRTADGFSPPVPPPAEEPAVRLPFLPYRACIVGSLGSPWEDDEPRALLDRAGVWFDGLGTNGAPRPRAALEVVLPLHRANREPLGVLILRRIDLTISFHERLIDASDLPFLELVGRHIETALENVVLYRELAAFTSVLELRVAERTTDLARTNDELARTLRRVREAQEQLLQAGRVTAVMTLVSGLSHELNNPIGIILGYAESILAHTVETAPLHRPLQAIARQAQRAGALIHTLTEFAQRSPSERKWASVGALLAAVAARIREEFAVERRVGIEIRDGFNGLPPLFVSIDDVESALRNVVKNAVEATPSGGTVSLGASVEGNEVEIAITDHGSGIAENVLPRIFDPFFSTKPVGTGMGLGLPLARQIVESHGGRIEVKSAMGRGTTMRITLPTGGAS